MIKKKVCLIGAFAVGKTSLIERFVNSIFSEKYQTTLGVKIDQKELNVDGKEIKLILWDLAGEDEFMSLQTSYLRGAAGLIFVADGTRAETLDIVLELHNRVAPFVNETENILLINKSDIEVKWSISSDKLISLENDGWTIIKTSAKDNQNVDTAFKHLASELLKIG